MSEELWLRRNAGDDRWVISTTPKLMFGREEESIFHTDENGADDSEPGSDGWKIAAKHANEVASGPTVTPSRLRAQFRVSNCSKNKEMNGDYVLDADFKVVGFPTWKHTTKDYFIRRDLADTCWLISTKVPENQTPRAGWHFFTCEDGVDKFEPSEHGAVGLQALVEPLLICRAVFWLLIASGACAKKLFCPSGVFTFDPQQLHDLWPADALMSQRNMQQPAVAVQICSRDSALAMGTDSDCHCCAGWKVAEKKSRLQKKLEETEKRQLKSVFDDVVKVELGRGCPNVKVALSEGLWLIVVQCPEVSTSAQCVKFRQIGFVLLACCAGEVILFKPITDGSDGDAEILDEIAKALEAIRKVAERKHLPLPTFEVSAHTDEPKKKYRNSTKQMEASKETANNAMKHLVEKKNIFAEMLTSRGFGGIMRKYNDSRNKRVEIKLSNWAQLSKVIWRSNSAHFASESDECLVCDGTCPAESDNATIDSTETC